MKKSRVTTAIMAMAIIGLTAMSCNDGKTTKSNENTLEKVHQSEEGSATMDHSNMTDSKVQNPDAQKVVASYMVLKDALVATDESAAAQAGKDLESSLKALKVDSYSSSEQKELTEIIESATESAEHISKSDIVEQREKFQMLTKDITDMIVITGTDNTLYQQYCPMYAGNKGGAWLSMEKEIRNPYFGSKMMKCGEVQKEIN